MSRSATCVALFLFLAAAACSVDSHQVTLELPTPDGCNPVGTKTISLKDAGRDRELLVTFWYPAVPSSAFAPYMDEKTSTEIAAEWKLQPDFARHVHTHSGLNAAFGQTGPFPVILLEHGSGTVPAIYTVLAEGLASRGFIVAATNHPPDSLIAVFPDGREIKAKPYWPENADRRTQGVAIGRFAEEVLLGDVRFVLDQLRHLNSQDTFWRGHFNLSRVGIVGHSMGGTTAALATKEERNISAGVNLDGSTYPGMNADVRPIELHKPFLFVATEEHASDPETRAREYVGSESNTYYVVIPGNDHMSFTDGRLLSTRFYRESSPNPATFERAQLAVELTRSLVEEFFAKYLNGDIAPHLDFAAHVDKK
jgi:dienelactone hydrolase